jgi:hypothetical protein
MSVKLWLIQAKEAKSPEDNVYFGTASDDSDIVTLEPPKLEEIGSQEVVLVKEAHSSDGFNMGSSSSSQYTFCQPETGKTAKIIYWQETCWLLWPQLSNPSIQL